MGYLSLLKSPKVIGTGIALLALGLLLWSWHSRGQEIDTLKARLANCNNQRTSLARNVEDLRADIAEQNRAIEKLRKSRNAAAKAAEKRIRAIEVSVDNRAEAVRTAQPSGTSKEKLCESARKLLVR